AEMVLAEKDALEAQGFVVRPEVEIARKMPAHVHRAWLAVRARQLGEELEQPRLDHGRSSSPESPAAIRLRMRTNSVRFSRPTRRSRSRSCSTAAASSSCMAA